MRLETLCQVLDEWFPPSLSESWDNVGLLLGDLEANIGAIMTCLTVTAATAEEAIAEKADLVVSHHPIFFRPISRLTADGPEGPAFRLARAGVAVYSPHTSFDSAELGINEQIARRLDLRERRPLRPNAESNAIGAGRWGILGSAISLADLSARVKTSLNAACVDLVGDPGQVCRTVAIGCGSAGEFLTDAVAEKADVFITGEVRFHQALEAEAMGIALVLAGHYATERFAVETLADRMKGHWPDLRIWASARERDPFTRLG